MSIAALRITKRFDDFVALDDVSVEVAAGSLTARSASTFRSSPISAFLQPAMNWLYESPFCLAAALIRKIQSRRNSRLRFFRSR